MENLELAISERTRTNQLCGLTAILGTLLAIWARDPLLEIGIPLASVEVRNLTAGHAVLLGYPLLTILIFLMAGQILRMNRVVSTLSLDSQILLKWNMPTPPDFCSKLERCVLIAAGSTKYFSLIAIPFIASIVLACSLFEFRVCSNDCCTEAKELSVYQHLFTTELWETRPSYMGLTHEEADNNLCNIGIDKVNDQRSQIQQNLPYTYAPWLNWVYWLLQLPLLTLWWYLTKYYFSKLKE